MRTSYLPRAVLAKGPTILSLSLVECQRQAEKGQAGMWITGKAPGARHEKVWTGYAEAEHPLSLARAERLTVSDWS